MLRLFFPCFNCTPRINPVRLDDFAHGYMFMSLGTSLWVGVGTLVLGAATSLYSANAQKKANQGAQNANATAQDKQNAASWTNWLMTKGIMPTTPVAAGVMPSAGGYAAVNTKLPIWANVNYGATAPGVSASGGGIRLVKKGTATQGITGLVATLPGASAAPVDTTTAPAATGGGMSSGTKGAIAGALLTGDPIMGAIIGNNSKTAKKVLDPFGLFG